MEDNNILLPSQLRIVLLIPKSHSERKYIAELKRIKNAK